MYRAAAVVLLLAAASSARAQVIYQPLQYQYGMGDGVAYYYGGNRPATHEYVERVKCHDGFPSGVTGSHYNGMRGVLGQTTEKCYVFTDCIHGNAAVYGYTAVDAQNEMMSNLPLYYTKRDLLLSAVPAADGNGLLVPAMGRPAGEMVHVTGPAGAATQPSEPKPRAIIIIPKSGAPKHAPSDDEVKKAVAAVN